MSPRLATVSGVGHVAVQGGIKPAVRIQADLARLAAYGLSMADLRTAIAAANVSGPKGSLDGKYQYYAISSNDQITNAEAYKAVIVAFRNNAPVLLKDVAEVVDGLENNKVGGWFQGKPAVVIDVHRQRQRHRDGQRIRPSCRASSARCRAGSRSPSSATAPARFAPRFATCSSRCASAWR
jgi:multidrug efflux pump